MRIANLLEQLEAIDLDQRTEFLKVFRFIKNHMKKLHQRRIARFASRFVVVEPIFVRSITND